MMELRRLLEQGATDAERALLDSARADGPGDGAAQRTLVAVAALTAASGGPSAPGSGPGSGIPPAAAHAVQLGALAKVGLVALFGVAALGAGVLVHRWAGPSEMPGVRARVVQPEPTPQAPSTAAKQTAAVSEASPPSPRGSAGALHRQVSPTEESLSAEIRILDVARAAVDAHDPAAAERALASHAERFPQGHLKPEASVLRLAVLVQQGQRESANALAAQLLASKQYEAYQYRIRSLLREAGE